jgi:SsrA-binding protein
MSEKNSSRKDAEKLVATNPNGRSSYFIEETFEAGIVLTGTEVKSMRASAPNIRDAFVEVKSGGKVAEAWLMNVHISHYAFGNIWNHEPLRRRKLLLHAHEIHKMYGAVTQKGLSIIPLKLYFKNGRLKVELGMGKGKKKYDKRQDLKKKSAEREMDVARKDNRSKSFEE